MGRPIQPLKRAPTPIVAAFIEAWLQIGNGAKAFRAACAKLQKPPPKYADVRAYQILHSARGKEYLAQLLKEPHWWAIRREQIRSEPSFLIQALKGLLQRALETGDSRFAFELCMGINHINMSEAKLLGMLIERKEIIGNIGYMQSIRTILQEETGLPAEKKNGTTGLLGPSRANGSNGDHPVSPALP